MNARERVRKTIAREDIDHIPLGFYAVDCDIVEKVIGRKTFVRNKIAIRLALSEGRRDEIAQSLKEDVVDFFKKIDCADIILPKEGQRLPPKDYEPEKLIKIDDSNWKDQKGNIYRANWDTNEISCIQKNEPEKEYNVDDFKIPEKVDPIDDSCFEVFDHIINVFGKDRYVCSEVPITALTRLGSFENAMMMYAMQPEVIHAANKQSVFLGNKHDDYYIRKGTSGVYIDQDMAGTNGPFISADMFREMCFPYFKKRIDHIKKYRDQVIFHNCGNNIPLMDMFIEGGIDVYQSLQTTAGMEIGKLKEMYGHKICFWGGVAIEKLIMGSPDEVRAEVRNAFERGAKGGGFILGPSHSIAYGTKYDNFMAMIDEYDKLKDKY